MVGRMNNRTKKADITDNLFSLCNCKSISDRYLNEIKASSKVNDQPFKPPYMPLSSKLYEAIYLFQYKSLVTRPVLDFILRWTWGMGGISKKKNLGTKVGLTMAHKEIARRLHTSEKRVREACKELEDANIILVEKHVGIRKPDGSRLPNYYFFNKHYDTWKWVNDYVGSSADDSSADDSSAVDGSTDSVELGLTEYLPIRDGAKVGLLKMVSESQLEGIAIDATNTIKSQGLSMDRYEGILFSEAKKLKDSE